MPPPTRPPLTFPRTKIDALGPYLPPPPPPSRNHIHVTLTYAQSLDSSLTLSPGTQTHLSGPSSKSLTHFLRSCHDAIVIGVGTAIADDPSLNCRLEGVGGYGGKGLDRQPRPVIVDPRGRWEVSEQSACIVLAREGRGRGPVVLTAEEGYSEERKMVLESVGGKVVAVRAEEDGKVDWGQIFEVLGREGLKSVMVEGGGSVINELLSARYLGLVDAVIVTIAPTWLGAGGVQVCPEARVEEGVKIPVARLQDVIWVPMGDDVVLCGHPM